MFWLVIIWIVAALCGLAAAAVWEPLLAMSLAIARTVDPGFASFLAQYAAIVESGGDAIGWLVALVVGLPLTLLWLVLRVVGSALRGPDARRSRPSDDRRRDVHRDAARSRPANEPAAGRIDRPAPRGSAFDVPPRSPPRSRETDAVVPPRDPAPVRPDPEPPVDAPPVDAPRWGRQ